MSGLFDQQPDDEAAVTGEGAPQTDAERRDAEARLRPPDPAGTQPRSILPAIPPKPLDVPRPPALGPAPGAFGDTLAGPAGEGGELVASGPAGEAPHAARFQFLVGGLIALGVSAVAIAAFVLGSPGAGPSVAWSPWHPVNNGTDPAQQIADHVGPKYRLDTGAQLVQVTGGPLAVSGTPVVVAVQQSGSDPKELAGNGVFYELCGQGTSCSIAGGKPSTQRMLLLRREALELALYTFRYVSGVNQVVVRIPPPPPTAAAAAAAGSSGSSASGAGTSATGSSGLSAGSGAAGGAGASSTATGASGATGATGATGGSSGSSSSSASTTPVPHALFFRPTNVASELSRPLGLTLSDHTPTVSTVTAASDTPMVDQLTRHAIYSFSLVHDQQQNPVLLLVPPGLGG